MSLEIKVIATKTYTKSKHFLSVMIFVNLWNLTFASELPHLFHYSLYVLMNAEKHCMNMYSYWGGKVIELFLIKNKCHKQKSRLSGRQSSTGMFQEKLMRQNINIGSPITCSWCEEFSEGKPDQTRSRV